MPTVKDKAVIRGFKKSYLCMELNGDQMIPSALPERVKQELVGNHTKGKKKGDKPLRVPEMERLESLYLFDAASKYAARPTEANLKKRLGFPAIAFKQAGIDACRAFPADVKMTEMRVRFWSEAHPRSQTAGSGTGFMPMIPITCEKMIERTDFPPLKTGDPMPTFRYGLVNWKAQVVIGYPGNTMSMESVLDIFQAAGECIGVGAWRPYGRDGGTGDFGRFDVRPIKATELDKVWIAKFRAKGLVI
jgi:hypothetical protein